MASPWHEAQALARARADYLDLTDSRYHQNGLLPDRRVFEDAFRRYLDQRAYDPDSRGAPAARQALARFYQGEGWTIPEDQFFLTAGTSEAYALLFSTLAEAGDEVLLPRPGYPLFDHIARHSRLETAFYQQPFSANFGPDAVDGEARVTPRTKFVVVISPNNPTGRTLTAAELAPVADLCRRHDLMLVVDEVFDAGWTGPGPMPRPGALFPDVKTFTLNGISKRFGSPDLKLAWTAVTGPAAWVTEVGEQLELANDTFLSANSFSQFLLPELFETMKPWQDQYRALLATNRVAVVDFLAANPRVRGVVPEGGIHGLWRFDGLPKAWDDERWGVELLRREALSLHPGYFYDLEEPGVWMVYSLLKEPAAFAEGLGRLSARLNAVS